MQVVVGLIVIVVAIALSPWLLPIAGLVWGVKTLRSAEHAGNSRRRGFAVASVVGSLAFAGIVWPGVGGNSDAEEAAAEPVVAASPAASESESTSLAPTPEVTSDAPPSPSAAPSDVPVGDAPSTDVSNALATVGTAEAPDPAVIPAATSTLVPVVGIIDGDTIKVRIGGATERVRVIGIDTPELAGGECYAQQAASKMQSLAQSRSVSLESDPTQADRDRYDRLLRHVFLDDGRSAAEVLIAGGFGREYTYAADYRYQDSYRAAEARARSAGSGLWGSGCDTQPVSSQERSTVDRSSGESSGDKRSGGSSATKDAPARVVAEPPASSGSCDIKGNISSKGEKIYHVPGGRSYNATKISQSKGERWFCSTSEAESAGWRAARG